MMGCQTVGYYGQAVTGQAEVLLNAKSIEKLLQNSSLDLTLKERLKKIQRIRNFAVTELGIPKNDSYLTYSDIKRSFVVWNVFVTPKLSLNPKEWCFPIAGCVTYRGFFDKKSAVSFAEEQKSENLDTVITGVSAYSTLGWFSDPVLNTFIHYSDISMVALIFHELAHQIIYVKNDTIFNESLAVSVSVEGVRRWLRKNGSEQDKKSWREARLSHEDYLQLIANQRKALETNYKSQEPLKTKYQNKKKIIDNLKREYKNLKTKWPKQTRYDGLFSKPINNATFVPLKTYSEYVPYFSKLLERNRNFPDFFSEVSNLSKQSIEKRLRVIQLSISN